MNDREGFGFILQRLQELEFLNQWESGLSYMVSSPVGIFLWQLVCKTA